MKQKYRMKTCRACGQRKTLRSYDAARPRTNGREGAKATVCRKCARERAAQIERWRQDGRACRGCGRIAKVPKEIGIAPNALCLRCNRDRRAERAREFRRKNPESGHRAMRRWRAKNPGQAAEASRRWRRRMMRDSEKRRRHLENRRISDKLRRLRNGQRTIRMLAPETYANGNGRVNYPYGARMVATAPLVPHLQKWLGPMQGKALNGDPWHRDQIYAAGLGTLAELAGTDQRNLFAILHGERARISIDGADRLLAAIDVPFGMVYPP